MSNFTYSAMSGKNDPVFGKFEHPIKALIENESDICEKRKSILDILYNVEESNSKEDEIDAIEFTKEFTITRQMVDDAKTSMDENMKNKPKKFVHAYYKTRVKIAAQALIHGTEKSMLFNKSNVDLTTADGLELFSNKHPYSTDKLKGKTQSNYFYGDLTSDVTKLEEMLGVLANKVRNFKDENGEVMGYVADVLIIPCNRPKLENMIKKVVSSERAIEGNNVDTKCGNWTIVVLNGWETDDDRFMVMSTEANNKLLGNMFYDKATLHITSNIDEHKRNYNWNGCCSLGVGFNTWQHIALAVNSTTAVAGATALHINDDGGESKFL